MFTTQIKSKFGTNHPPYSPCYNLHDCYKLSLKFDPGSYVVNYGFIYALCGCMPGLLHGKSMLIFS